MSAQTLAQLVSDVYAITNRPDMVNETNMAIRAATLKAHHLDFFYRDVQETGINFGTLNYTQSFEPRTVIPNFRATKYLRKYDSKNSCAGMILVKKDLNDILDSYGVEYVNIYYGAGAEIQIKMNTQEQYLLFGCYIHPDVTLVGYNSWIADEYPQAIVYDAAATVFKLLTDSTSSNMYSTMTAIEYNILIANNISLEGA